MNNKGRYRQSRADGDFAPASARAPVKASRVAPAQWKFDASDWWLEEYGLIMEKPTFPLPAGKYLVTGDRDVTTVLTVHPKDKDGNQRWELAASATLYDVTHLGCRSARYTPATAATSRITRF